MHPAACLMPPAASCGVRTTVTPLLERSDPLPKYDIEGLRDGSGGGFELKMEKVKNRRGDFGGRKSGRTAAVEEGDMKEGIVTKAGY